MNDNGSLLLVGAAIFFIVGALWMRIYFRFIEPALRCGLGRLLGVTIYLGEENIWQINDESVDSLNPRNVIIRPLQVVALLFAAMLPLVVTMVVLVVVTR
ncbi:MAG TPA: hypothetical protein VHO69_07050 [Phototrophicaceae bacterium]|nr:hypothetical protein [Phototrophicaceae bacterium]